MRRRLNAVVAVAGLFYVYLITSNLGSDQNTDTMSAAIPAWSLAQHGTLDIPQYEGGTPWIVRRGDDVLSDRMPGIILWAVPFFRLFGTPDGPSTLVAAIAAVTATTAAVVLLYRIFRRLLDARAAVVGAALVAFGTATWTISADALWPHGPAQMWLAGAMLLMSTQTWWGAGLAYAASITIRPHLAVAAAISGLWESVARRSLKPLIQVGLTSALGVAALLVYNTLVFGETTLLIGVYAGRTTTAADNAASLGSLQHPLLRGLLGTLFSPVRGVLVLSPFLIMLLPGLVKAWRVAPTWARASATGGIAYMLVQLFGNAFEGGARFYSYRLPIEALTLAVPLLALCWREWTSRTSRRRVVFAVLAVFSVVQHAVGAFIFYDPPTENQTRPWDRYLFIQELQQATVTDLVILGLVTTACSWIAYRLLKDRLLKDTAEEPVGATQRLSNVPEASATR